MTAQRSSTAHRYAELVQAREPFVHATVVRAQHPSSARAGDAAIVHPDGRIDGFVGGQCAVESVRSAALGALKSKEGVLLRVLPDEAEQFPETPGAVVAVNPCLSGGALEIFLEPVLPAPICHVVGSSPIARAVLDLIVQVGFETSSAEEGERPDGAIAAIVSSHGGDEPAAIRSALDAGVPFIGLVASAKRGAAILDEMGLDDEARSRVHTPVGLDIGAETPVEIALSIIAAIVRAVRVEAIEPPASHRTVLPLVDQAPAQAHDPVCGMTVTVTADTPHAVVDGEDVWFCCPGCRDRYVAEHSA